MMLLCVHLSLSLWVYVHVFVHVSACIFTGPVAAVLDRYSPEADLRYWQGGKGGMQDSR